MNIPKIACFHEGQYVFITITANGQTYSYQLKACDEGVVFDAVSVTEGLEAIGHMPYSAHPDHLLPCHNVIKMVTNQDDDTDPHERVLGI